MNASSRFATTTFTTTALPQRAFGLRFLSQASDTVSNAPLATLRVSVVDSLGNTTAAVAKGFAVGSAALTALALFKSFEYAIVDADPTTAGDGVRATAGDRAADRGSPGDPRAAATAVRKMRVALTVVAGRVTHVDL